MCHLKGTRGRPATQKTTRWEGRRERGAAETWGLNNLERGLMLNHAAGTAIGYVMYELASKASMTVMPGGCPICVATEASLRHLPPELRDGARVVNSGAEILAVLDEH